MIGQGVIALTFEKAVLEPTFCPMYSQLCSHLSSRLPQFPSTSAPSSSNSSTPAGEKSVTFRRVLLNTCQEEFEGAARLRGELKALAASKGKDASPEEVGLTGFQGSGPYWLLEGVFSDLRVQGVQ